METPVVRWFPISLQRRKLAEATDQNRTDISSLEGWGNNHYTTVALNGGLLYPDRAECVKPTELNPR